MATDKSFKVISGKTVSPLLLGDVSSDPFYKYLLITRICMKSWMISKFSQIRPRTAELAALVRLKISHRLLMGKMVSLFSWILFILAGNSDIHELEIWPDLTTDYRVSCP